MTILCSVVTSCRGRLGILRRTLESIVRQNPPFEWEVVLVNHGGPRETEDLCRQFSGRGPEIRYAFLPSDRYMNPGPALNLAWRLASGEVLVSQSSDVIHAAPDTVEKLVSELEEDNFVIGNVVDCVVRPGTYAIDRSRPVRAYTAPRPLNRRRPLFFLGAVFRKHICSVGGNAIEFDRPGFDDAFLADCLINGLQLRPHYSAVRGYHQRHRRPPSLSRDYAVMRQVYARLRKQAKKTGQWRGGLPWPYVPGKSVEELVHGGSDSELPLADPMGCEKEDGDSGGSFVS